MKKTSLSDKMMYCTCNKKDNERPIRVLKVDEDVKEAIKELKKRMFEDEDPIIIINEVFGEELCLGVEE